MARFFGPRRALMLGITLAAVIFGGWKTIIPSANDGKAVGDALSNAVATARGAQAGDSLAIASADLQAFQVLNGTFVGAQVSPASGVRLVWVGPASYCLETVAAATVAHEIGPGGTAVAGACPAGS